MDGAEFHEIKCGGAFSEGICSLDGQGKGSFSANRKVIHWVRLIEYRLIISVGFNVIIRTLIVGRIAAV